MAKCDRCLWSDKCRTSQIVCDDYTPISEEEVLDKMIEERRYEFRHLWSIYVSENIEKV